MRKIIYFASLLFLPLLQAQENSVNKYGIYGDYGLNMHTADFRALPGVPNCCPKFQDGDGLGLSFGALFEMDMTRELFLSARLGYNDISGKLTRIEPTTIILNNTPVDGEFTHTVDTKIQAVTARILAGYRIIPNISFYAGFGAGNVIKATYKQIETITNPSDRGTFIDGDTGFDTGKRTRNESSGDIPKQNSLRLFLSAGIGYELPLNSDNSLRLMPEVNFDFALSNVVNQINWKINELKAGIALKYVPITMSGIQIIRDTIIKSDTTIQYITDKSTPSVVQIGSKVIDQSESIEPGKKLITTTILNQYLKKVLNPINIADKQLHKLKNSDISISVKGINYDGKMSEVGTMRIEEFISDVIHPLLPYIFFDDNSSTIPARYKHINDTNQFTENSLLNDETLDVYYNLLNIVGKRLTDNPNATIKLVGTNSNIGDEKDNLELSQYRAEAVKNYLENTWGIDKNRISTEARGLPQNASNTVVDDGIAENRRVEISSSNSAILDIIRAKDTLRKSDPPTLRFMTDYKGTESYDKWEIEISQNGKILKKYSGNNELPKTIDWNLEQEQSTTPRFDSPLDYKLVLTKGSEIVESIAQLPMQMIKLSEKAINKVGDKQIDKYNLILFDFNSATISGRNSEIVNMIKSRIKDSSTIQIKGYTDRMGDESINERLSNSRAESANKALNIGNALSKGYGEKIELYDNELPEGRMYSRTVEIIVETPIK